MGNVFIYGSGSGGSQGGDLGEAFSAIATKEYDDSLMGAWWWEAIQKEKLGETLFALIGTSFAAYKEVKTANELFANAGALDAFMSNQTGRKTAFYSLYCVTDIAGNSNAFNALIADTDRLVDYIQSVTACHEMVKYENNMTAMTASTEAMKVIADNSDAMQAIIANPNALNAMVNSSLAMQAVANNTNAMQAMIANPNALTAMVNSSIAMAAIADNSDAMQAMIANPNALTAMVNSSVAMKEVANSSVAMKEVANSSVARAAIESSTSAITALNAKCATKTGLTIGTAAAPVTIENKVVWLYQAWNSSNDKNSSYAMFVGVPSGSSAYISLGTLGQAQTRKNIQKFMNPLKMYSTFSSTLAYGGVSYYAW